MLAEVTVLPGGIRQRVDYNKKVITKIGWGLYSAFSKNADTDNHDLCC